MSQAKPDYFVVCGGELAVWVDAERSIHIKILSDPNHILELNSEAARELADLLLKLAARID